MQTDRWVLYPKPNAGMRLYCFPYAGDGFSAFRVCADDQPDLEELAVVQLPGRGSRVREAPFKYINPLIDALIPRLRLHLYRTFVLFGHSMGALIAFEAARRLSAAHRRSPFRLFALGQPAPQILARRTPLHLLPSAKLLDEISRLNGTPPEVLENQELMQLLLPAIRSELAVVETCVNLRGPPLDCPITAFGGRKDAWTDREDLQAWRHQTSRRFSLHQFPGDHFFLHTAQSVLLTEMSLELRS